MEVELLHCSPKWIIVEGIRTCWKSFEKSDSDCVNDVLGPNDISLVKKIISFGHTSTLEHSLFTFKVDGISRALLQELSRHRVGVSPSVESTRYTLKKIINNEEDIANVLVSSGNEDIDALNEKHLRELTELIKEKGLTNDVAKYGLVESYKVSETISFNLRSLRHFYQLRTSKKALKEIQELAHKLVEALPEDYNIFFEDLVQ